MKWFIALLTIPIWAQPSVTCTAPVATVAWTANPAYPALYVRIYPSATVIPSYLDQVKAGMRQVGPIIGTGNVTFAGLTVGPYQAYLFQDTPYVELSTVAFTCMPIGPDGTVPGPNIPNKINPLGITITLDGKTVGTFGTLKLVTGVNINIILTDNKDGSATVQVSAPATATGAAQ